MIGDFDIGKSIVSSVERLRNNLNSFNLRNIHSSNIRQVVQEEQESLNRFSDEIELMFKSLDKDIETLMSQRFEYIIQKQIPNFEHFVNEEITKILNGSFGSDAINKLALTIIQNQLNKITKEAPISNSKELFFRRSL